MPDGDHNTTSNARASRRCKGVAEVGVDASSAATNIAPAARYTTRLILKPVLVFVGKYWSMRSESREGISPSRAPRTVREPLDSYFSQRSAICVEKRPVGEQPRRGFHESGKPEPRLPGPLLEAFILPHHPSCAASPTLLTSSKASISSTASVKPSNPDRAAA